jgi:hypothetical protein
MAAMVAAAIAVSAVKAYNSWRSAKAAGKNAKAEKARLDEIRAQLKALPLPDLKAVYADYPDLQGDLVELTKAVPVEKLDDTKMSGVTTDSRLTSAQYEGLDTLDEISKEGMTETDRYALEGIRQTGARDEASQRGAAMQALAQRGLGGAGAEISARLLAQQGGANRGADQAMQLAAEKRAAALQAVMNRSKQSSGMRNQEFNEKSQIAQAQDKIATFNATAQNKAYDSQRNAIEAQMAREDLNAKRKSDQDIANQKAANDLEESQYAYKTNQINPDLTGASIASDNAAKAKADAEKEMWKAGSDTVATVAKSSS